MPKSALRRVGRCLEGARDAICSRRGLSSIGQPLQDGVYARHRAAVGDGVNVCLRSDVALT